MVSRQAITPARWLGLMTVGMMADRSSVIGLTMECGPDGLFSRILGIHFDRPQWVRIAMVALHYCKFAGKKPIETFDWDRPALNGILSVFEDIDDYMSVRMHMSVGSDRFSLSYKAGGAVVSYVFKNQPLGCKTFSKIVKDVCACNGIAGTGNKKSMTTNGLRGTVTTMRVEAGHSDAAIAMRTGNKDPKFLQNYQTIQGCQGERQKFDILDGFAKGLKRSSMHAHAAQNHNMRRCETKECDENVIPSFKRSGFIDS